MDETTTSQQLTTTATTEVTTIAEPKKSTTTAPPTSEQATVMDEPTTSEQLTTTTATTEVTTRAEPKISTTTAPPTTEQSTVMDEPTTLAQLETTTTTEVTSAEPKISTTTAQPTTEQPTTRIQRETTATIEITTSAEPKISTTEEATTVNAEPTTLGQRETTVTTEVTTSAEPKITATTVSPTTKQTGTCEPFPQESQRICGPFTGYNSTSFPNAFGHLSTQQIINSAEFLLVTFALNTISPTCTQNASTAFCRMFLPQCEDGTQIQLCRNDCDEINARCTPVELSELCNVLPYHNDDPTCSLVLQPTPTAVECPVLTAPGNGALSPAGSRQYQDVVTFTCNPGYVLNGAAAATCQAGGTWSNPVPTCTRKTTCKLMH
ncbi:uncharacterized protein LOC144922266 [Branchiostoma floridae x Branchiostoma belcheri]